MAYKITAFECEYCHNKVLKTKSGINSHEKKCFFNLASKSCVTCENYNKGEIFVHTELAGSPKEYIRGSCECDINLTRRLQNQCDKWKPIEQELAKGGE